MLFTQRISEKMLQTHNISREEVVKELKAARLVLETRYPDIPEINRRQIVVRFFRLHEDDSIGIGWAFDEAPLEMNYSDLNYPSAEFYIVATLQRIRA